MVKERKEIHMKIKVLLVMPDKEAQVVRIPANIKFLKAFLGENLLRIKLDDNNMIIANKDAKIDEFNRFLNGNVILGTFIIVSVRKNNRKVSMKKRDIRKYTNFFKLRKHQKKIDKIKDEYLEEFYFAQRKRKLENRKRNKEIIFKIAA